MMNGSNTSNIRYPFTQSQWQELEHQALIYKYMASGVSIPPHLIFTIKRTFLDSPISSSLMHPHHWWNYLQMGVGRKIDPEPGRCRRTDGKKWRCSKEAYPDSKYCERHMHRGKNRSRKPVELLKTPTNITSNTTNDNNSALTSSTTHSLLHQTSSVSSNTHHHPYSLYNHQPSRSSSIGFSFEDNSSNAPSFLGTGSCSQTNTDSRTRYVYGLKEEVDEHAFFTEQTGTMRSFSTSSMDDSWQLTPLTMSSSSSSKQRSCNGLSNDYPYLQLQSLSDDSKQVENQDHGCYNIRGSSASDIKHEPQKTVHRFFDEWPHKSSRGSWLDLDHKSSTTQLSISIPTSAHDFPNFSSRTHHDG
ncbi:PREDICTED: growth-regulating factor 1-like isoform X2 [Lupinus angustifolius]|uniref:growth-regulating factor 1-like isoform X2 n=1 Tax=Lupinus angustifolius TaxID=3871 RepID=UPI00092E3AC7|nr:PREDICTED: growth-regulating factor 1-like isoform X2 [Lupinus angustifolius]